MGLLGDIIVLKVPYKVIEQLKLVEVRKNTIRMMHCEKSTSHLRGWRSENLDVFGQYRRTSHRSHKLLLVVVTIWGWEHTL